MATVQVKAMDYLDDLIPFMGMTIEPGVTVGDFAFTSAQDIYSTTFITPTADNTLPANINADLFQAAIGDTGQGLASGVTMTRAQTSWLDSGGRLGANECFVGISASFKVFKIRVGGATTGQTSSSLGCSLTNSSTVLLPNSAAATQILNNLSWQYNIGDTIPRIVGPLAQWPQGCGAWQAPADISSGTVTGGTGTTPSIVSTFTGTVQAGQGVQNGAPFEARRKFDVPFILFPNVKTSIKILSGNALALPTLAATNNANLPYGGNLTLQAAAVTTDRPYVEFLAVQMCIGGYKLTRNV